MGRAVKVPPCSGSGRRTKFRACGSYANRRDRLLSKRANATDAAMFSDRLNQGLFENLACSSGISSAFRECNPSRFPDCRSHDPESNQTESPRQHCTARTIHLLSLAKHLDVYQNNVRYSGDGSGKSKNMMGDVAMREPETTCSIYRMLR